LDEQRRSDPEAVGDRITKILDNQNNIVDAFTRICLDRVRRDANSAINVERIKDLVAGLVGGASHD
jgi:hypothetical protein